MFDNLKFPTDMRATANNMFTKIQTYYNCKVAGVVSDAKQRVGNYLSSTVASKSKKNGGKSSTKKYAKVARNNTRKKQSTRKYKQLTTRHPVGVKTRRRQIN